MTPILKDGKTVIPDDAIRSIKKNTVALKGPLATPSMFLSLAPQRLPVLTDCDEKSARVTFLLTLHFDEPSLSSPTYDLVFQLRVTRPLTTMSTLF